MIPAKVQANERIRAAQLELHVDEADKLPFLCECDDVSCRRLIRLTAAEYALARESPNRCVVVEGHAHEGRVVTAGHGYVVAEK